MPPLGCCCTQFPSLFALFTDPLDSDIVVEEIGASFLLEEVVCVLLVAGMLLPLLVLSWLNLVDLEQI